VTLPAAAVVADSEALGAKERRLHHTIASYESVIVAFSGGVDSAYLAVSATRVLGASALCVTADSPSYPEHHRRLARDAASTTKSYTPVSCSGRSTGPIR
jgi:PP-loop superfamily ATP-utilizing enzyme